MFGTELFHPICAKISIKIFRGYHKLFYNNVPQICKARHVNRYSNVANIPCMQIIREGRDYCDYHCILMPILCNQYHYLAVIGERNVNHPEYYERLVNEYTERKLFPEIFNLSSDLGHLNRIRILKEKIDAYKLQYKSKQEEAVSRLNWYSNIVIHQGVSSLMLQKCHIHIDSTRKYSRVSHHVYGYVDDDSIIPDDVVDDWYKNPTQDDFPVESTTYTPSADILSPNIIWRIALRRFSYQYKKYIYETYLCRLKLKPKDLSKHHVLFTSSCFHRQKTLRYYNGRSDDDWDS